MNFEDPRGVLGGSWGVLEASWWRLGNLLGRLGCVLDACRLGCILGTPRMPLPTMMECDASLAWGMAGSLAPWAAHEPGLFVFLRNIQIM